ncbi:hypothetical protein [Roseibacillus persicicus]|uniref:hypothetical protein n=1 Tax=Roseibacillus persicicus TaxID=454148 RepID=UPI002810F5D6|nr:hypothetical protein [Roseibacillus persicicus]
MPEPEATQLAVDEPVSVFVPEVVASASSGDQEVIPVETPFMKATELEPTPPVKELTPLAELVSSLMAEEDGPEDAPEGDRLVPMDPTPENLQFTPEEAAELEEGVEVFSEVFPASEIQDFAVPEEVEEVIEEESPQFEAPEHEPEEEESKSIFEPVEAVEATVEVLEPVSAHSAVQTWQPPSSNAKAKKNPRFGAFFR